MKCHEGKGVKVDFDKRGWREIEAGEHKVRPYKRGILSVLPYIVNWE
jgi:hypothetical protein